MEVVLVYIIDDVDTRNILNSSMPPMFHWARNFTLIA